MKYILILIFAIAFNVGVYCLIEKRSILDNDSKETHNDTSTNSICSGKLCIPTSYDRLSRPKSKLEISFTQVNVGFTIMDIIEVDDKEFSVTLSMYLAISWKDLSLTKTQVCESKPCYVPLDPEMISKIWHPDLYIYNLKSAQVLKVLDRFEGLFLI